jgi:hypothetical protein
MKQYLGDEQLPIPNQWNYILEKEVKEKRKPQNNGEANKKGSREVSPVDSANVKGGNDLPTSAIENPTNLNVEKAKESPKPQVNRPSVTSSNKKRVQLLMSVPRGAKVDEDKKNNLISQYLSKNNQTSSKDEKIESNVNDDEIIEIID